VNKNSHRSAIRALSFAAVFSLAVAARADVVGAARVIDGDTLRIDGDKIRLYGIDAPERRQGCEAAGADYPCGIVATAWMVERTVGNQVRCEGKRRDRYRRLIAVCYVGGESLNAAIVKAGWALAYRRYAVEYVPAEDDARRNIRGMWAGTFEPPWQWRRINAPGRR
jgi:endonuclease YncB( thermonuclease family)